MILLIIITLMILSAAAYSDIMTREVPDYLSYSLFAIVIGFSMINSVEKSDYTIIISSIAGALIGFAIGWTLFYLGQWGGGDAKLLLGMGGLIGFDLHSILVQRLWVYLLFLFAGGALYSLAWTIVLFSKDRKKIIKSIYEQRKVIRRTGLYMLIPSGISLYIAYQFGVLYFLFVPFLIYLFLFLMFFIKAVEKVSFIKEICIDELTEGDWILSKFEGLEINRYGIEKDEIDELKNRKVKKVKIRIGVPFVPSFLIGYVLFLLL